MSSNPLGPVTLKLDMVVITDQLVADASQTILAGCREASPNCYRQWLLAHPDQWGTVIFRADNPMYLCAKILSMDIDIKDRLEVLEAKYIGRQLCDLEHSSRKLRCLEQLLSRVARMRGRDRNYRKEQDLDWYFATVAEFLFVDYLFTRGTSVVPTPDFLTLPEGL